MNWVDLVLAVVGIFALYQGYKMGLIGALCNLVGLFVGIWVAANFNDVIMGAILDQGNIGVSLATLLSYIVIIVGVFMGAQIVRRIIKTAMNIVLLGWVDSLGAVVVGVLFGVLACEAVILGFARMASDATYEDPNPATIISEMTGLRGAVGGGLTESSLTPSFIEIVEAIPASAFGMVPGDLGAALDEVAAEIEAVNAE